MSAIKRFGRRAAAWTRRFATARNGGVALMFALAMPPMTLMAVCGLDLQRASSVKRSLQDALDAATLAAARSSETTDAGMRRVGMYALRANLAQFPYVALDEAIANTNFDLNADGSVTGTAYARVDTLAAGAFLGDALDVRTESMVFRSNNRVEVALVIDNTGSMNSYGRLTAARNAAIDLVERMEAASDRSVDPDAIRISLVPFSDTVRVHPGFGAQNNRSSANAMSWLGRAEPSGTAGLYATGTDRFALLDTVRIGWGGCVESRAYPYDVRDVAPTNAATRFVPYMNPDTPDRDAFDGRNTTMRNQWRSWYDDGEDDGAINDWINETPPSSIFTFLNDLGILSSLQRLLRLKSSWMTDVQDQTKYQRANVRSGIGSSLGPNRGCAIQPVVRLTDDFGAVIDSIEDMRADGTTNVPMGLMWGWHTLSPRAPFADGRPYGEERLQKIVILLTDGDNVNNTGSTPDDSEYTGIGLIWQNRIGVVADSSSGQRAAALNARQAELCANMRADGVMLYTIGVQVSSTSQALLQTCATQPDMFYNVSNTAGIAMAFDRIAGEIENLRIAR